MIFFISDQAEPRLHLGTATLLEYDSSGAQTEAFGAGEVLGGPVHGALAFGDTAHRLYVLSSAGYEPSAVQAFGPPAPGPLVQFASTRADPIGKTGATLDATVNPEGVKTTCHFQYVDEHSFESEGGFASPRTVTTPESASIGEGFEPQPASFSVAPGIARARDRLSLPRRRPQRRRRRRRRAGRRRQGNRPHLHYPAPRRDRLDLRHRRRLHLRDPPGRHQPARRRHRLPLRIPSPKRSF